MESMIVVLGYGNPARQDDGLGPAVAAEIEAAGLPGVTVSANYQLEPEDADLARKHGMAIFVDAGHLCAEPFEIRTVGAADAVHFMSHDFSPECILGLSQRAFGTLVAGRQVIIRGYEFELGEHLSPKALKNKEAAVAYIRSMIREWRSSHGCE